MTFNRSAVCEPFLELYAPSENTSVEPIDTKSPLYKEAIFHLMNASIKYKATIGISFGATSKRWRLIAGFCKANNTDFLAAVGDLLSQMYNIKPND